MDRSLRLGRGGIEDVTGNNDIEIKKKLSKKKLKQPSVAGRHLGSTPKAMSKSLLHQQNRPVCTTQHGTKLKKNAGDQTQGFAGELVTKVGDSHLKLFDAADRKSVV